jgi:prephenate dehydrogenase
MWRDICLTNRDAILRALELYRGTLEDFASAVESRNSEALTVLFERGRKMRERMK